VSWRERIRTVEIEPSLYAANFLILGEQIETLCDAGCRLFHFDMGDGHFVEPVTIGPIVLESIAGLIHDRGAAIDVHMMVDEPTRHFGQLSAAGADGVTFHFEAVADVLATIEAAREHGLLAGVAFNPETEPEAAAAVAQTADLVLCMAISPGYSGQAFEPVTLGRVERLRQALPERVVIQVDGGIGLDNIQAVRDAGADLFVAGSSVFRDADIGWAYRQLAQTLA
jgi:ribulose-phosphate 3-epimerase